METLSSKRNRVHHLVDYLKMHHCLLLEGCDDEHVKMHDVIRDVAISIASDERGKHMFLSEMGGNLEKWPRKDSYDFYTAISMEFNKGASVKFPDDLDCAKLNTLILSCGASVEFPPTFFRGMRNLKVLILKGMKIPEFPASIRSLVDMEVLCLEACDLGDLSWIGNLKKLDMLILQHSNFNLLPAEIGVLSHLRLLDLRECGGLNRISPGVISSLSTLQELFLPLMTIDERGLQSSLQWNLEELRGLSQLEALEMRVPPNSNLMELRQEFGFSFWGNLTKFRISINFDDWDGNWSLKNTLKLKGVSLSGWAVVQLLTKVERLYVRELNAGGNLKVLYDVGQWSFPKLQYFEADACQGITEFLSMVIDERSVSHLSVMRIFRCNLKYILSPYMAKVLPQLQTLEITNCKNLKSVVGGCQENDTELVVIFHRLEELNLKGLPMLMSFYPDSIEGCALQPLFTRKVGLPKLRELSLRSVDRVKEIWAGDIPPPPDSSLCNLTRLEIIDCQELVRAIPPAILPSLHRLESLIIGGCNSLREIVGSEAALGGGVASGGLPKLREIRLVDLPKLENFFSVPSLTCQCLSSIQIEGCGRLINLFSSPSTALGFAPNLQQLEIRKCEKMEKILSEGSTGNAASSPISLQYIFPCLKHLILCSLPKLTSLCPSAYPLFRDSSPIIKLYLEAGYLGHSSVQSQETLRAP